MGDSLAFVQSPPLAEEAAVHSREEEVGEVGRLQVNQEGEAVVVEGVMDHYLGAAVGVVVVLLCCPAEEVEEVVVVQVLRDPGEEVEGVVEEVVVEVPQPSYSVQWLPG